MSKLLLKNIYCIASENPENDVFSGDILIEGNKIAKIGKNIDKKAINPDRIIDCSNCVALPGMVNTHHHFYQTLTRVVPSVENAKLFNWLTTLYEIWKNIDAECVYYSSLTALCELLLTGCTLTTDHHYLYSKYLKGHDVMAEQFKAADKLGVRFSPTRGSMSLSKKDGGLPPDSVVQTEEEILEDFERVIKKYHDSSADSMHKVALAPCSPFSVTKKNMREAADLARKYSVRLHTHLCETIDEEDTCKKMYGIRPLELMQECGFIGSDVWYAHGIWFSDEELKVLADTKTNISHCPTSNMRLGSGICRTREMLDMGINVSIAVDGSASNDSSDMLAEARNALLLSRIRYHEKGLTARDVLKMATINGAKTLGYDNLGLLKEGWLADIILLPINDISYSSCDENPVNALFFTQNRKVKYSIINGKVVVDNFTIKGVDFQDILNHTNKCAKMIRSK